MEPLFSLRGVSKVFQMGEVEVPALRDLNLEIPRGSLVVVVGPSGSGKTTLLNILGGLDQPTSGSIEYGRQDLAAFGRRQLTAHRRHTVGFVFQFYNLIPDLTARENVMAATELSDDPMDPDEALALVGLTERADHFPSQLSGGEQQRVAIARAVAKNPELILCDEPTGALDLTAGRRVLELLLHLQRELGKTILLVTHNLSLCELGDLVVRMRSGEVAELNRNPSPRPVAEITW